MIRKLPAFLIPLISGGLLMTNPAGAAAEARVAEAPVHCLSLTRIKDSDVLDKKHIVFRMIDGSAYVSVLRHPCPGLTRNKAFLYRTSIGQLCDLDIVTVLDDVGFGLTPGASCGLGMFEPIDEQGIKNLKEGIKEGRIR